jgi:hypothetical protein
MNDLMNKTLLAIVVLLLPGISYCQDASIHDTTSKQATVRKHELRAGYGVSSFISIVEGVHAGEDGYDSRPLTKYAGTYSFDYRYQVNNRFSIGIGAAYERERVFVNSSSNGAITENSGTYKRQVLTVAPELIVQYPMEDERKVSVYGYLGIGVSFLNELDTYSQAYYGTGHYINGVNQLGNSREFANDKTEVAFQLCPIGLSAGGRIFGYAELGFGYKGIFNCGVGIKL